MEPTIAGILTTLQQTAKIVAEIGKISSNHETKLVNHDEALARHEAWLKEQHALIDRMNKTLADSIADSAKKWAEHEAWIAKHEEWHAKFAEEVEEWKALGRQNDERIAALVDIIDDLRRRPPAA